MTKITYKQSGVDIEKADKLVDAIRRITKAEKSPKAFCSFFDLQDVLKKCKKPVLVSSADGVGTKLKLLQQYGLHATAGIDLVAMNVNDIVCSGAQPLFFLDYIACGKLDVSVLQEVIQGIQSACTESLCKLIGGETAEMPSFYKDDEYDLAGFTVGVVDQKELIDGSAIELGDAIFGLPSSGPHSNGYSLIRKVLTKPELEQYRKEILAPTRLYVKPVLTILTALRKKSGQKKTAVGLAHITGGSFLKKATKIVPDGLTFRYQVNAWPIPKLFTDIQRKAGLSQEEIFETLNMGIGFMIVVRKQQQTLFENTVRALKIPCYKIGEVIKGKKAELS